MTKQNREFFRLDVSIPMSLEVISPEYIDQGLFSNLYLDGYSKQDQKALNVELVALFQDCYYLQNGGVKLFSELNLKLEFMIWLMENLMKGEDPRSDIQFVSRWKQYQSVTRPVGEKESSFIALLQDFYSRVEEITSELLVSFESSRGSNIYQFDQSVHQNLNCNGYLNNLKEQAEKGNWLAKVACLLVRKLNAYEDIFRVIKYHTQQLTQSDYWPVEQVSLSGNGFALSLSQKYALGETVRVFFLLDEQRIYVQAECISEHVDTVDKSLKRYAFKFKNIESEDEAKIVRYLNSQVLHNRVSTPERAERLSA